MNQPLKHSVSSMLVTIREAGEAAAAAAAANGGRVTLPTGRPWTEEVFVKSCVGAKREC